MLSKTSLLIFNISNVITQRDGQQQQMKQQRIQMVASPRFGWANKEIIDLRVDVVSYS